MEDDRVDGPAERQGGFLGILDGFAQIGCEHWYSRVPRKALVAEIIRWSTARAGTIGGPACTGIGLHTLNSRPVCTALGCHEEYRPGGHGGPHFSGAPPLTVL